MALLSVDDLEYFKVLRNGWNDALKIINEIIEKMSSGEYGDNEESELLETRLVLKMQEVIKKLDKIG